MKSSLLMQFVFVDVNDALDSGSINREKLQLNASALSSAIVRIIRMFQYPHKPLRFFFCRHVKRAMPWFYQSTKQCTRVIDNNLRFIILRHSLFMFVGFDFFCTSYALCSSKAQLVIIFRHRQKRKTNRRQKSCKEIPCIQSLSFSSAINKRC